MRFRPRDGRILGLIIVGVMALGTLSKQGGESTKVAAALGTLAILAVTILVAKPLLGSEEDKDDTIMTRHDVPSHPPPPLKRRNGGDMTKMTARFWRHAIVRSEDVVMGVKKKTTTKT